MPETSEEVKQTMAGFPAAPSSAVAECPNKDASEEKIVAPIVVKTAFEMTQNILHTIGARRAPDEKKDKTAWIEIVLVDMEGKPVPGVTYRITPPGGAAVEGTLNEHGQAGLYMIEPGSCKITFPDLDKEAWE